MCTYNGEKYLKEQIDSILNQTYPIYEIIVQDDCSIDNTWNIIQEYAKLHCNIIAERNEKNLGPNENYKKVLFKTKGEYILPADQDDIWFKNKLEILIRNIGDSLIIISQNIILYEDGTKEKTFNIFNPYVSYLSLFFGNCAGASSTMIHRNLLGLVYTWENIEVIGTDWRLPLVAYIANQKTIIDDNLMIWRRHNTNCTIAVTTRNRQNSFNKTPTNYQKFYKALIYLVLNKKSLTLKKQFETINNLLIPFGKRYERLYCKLLAEQSLFSFFIIGFLSVFLQDKISITKGHGILFRLKKSFFSFRFPFTYYFDHINSKK